MWRSEYQIQKLYDFEYRSGMEMNMRSCPKGCVPDATSYEPYDAYDSYEPYDAYDSYEPFVPKTSPKRKKTVKKPSACTIHRFFPEQCDAQPNCRYVKSTKRSPYCTTKRKKTSSNLYRSTNEDDGGFPYAHRTADYPTTTKKAINVKFNIFQRDLANFGDYPEITDVLRGGQPEKTDSLNFGGYFLGFNAKTKDERDIRYINERLYYIKEELIPTIINGIHQVSQKNSVNWFILPRSVSQESFVEQFESSFSSLFSYEKDENVILVSDDNKNKISTFHQLPGESKKEKDELVNACIVKNKLDKKNS